MFTALFAEQFILVERERMAQDETERQERHKRRAAAREVRVSLLCARCRVVLTLLLFSRHCRPSGTARAACLNGCQAIRVPRACSHLAQSQNR